MATRPGPVPADPRPHAGPTLPPMPSDELHLPVTPPVKPMLAKAVSGIDQLPEGELWFEPKWDGFRCIVFRDGDQIELGSRNERPLTRYFPELLPPLLAQLPPRCVVDGEIVLVGPDRLEFDQLQQRIHPAESRINRLAEETPASFVAFDLLALGETDLTGQPFSRRRAQLEVALAGAAPPIHLTPTTQDRDVAEDWFQRFEGAGLDGVMAKPADGLYVRDKRVQFKVKHQRTADCVVAGYRTHKSGDGVGSLLLGLWADGSDGGRELRHVGVAASFTAKRRGELVAELEPYEIDAGTGHPWQAWVEHMASADEAGKVAGGMSRWNAAKDLSWHPLRAELVAEVKYGGVLDGRFRPGVTQFLRWRPDRDPESCTFDQLELPPPVQVSEVFAG